MEPIDVYGYISDQQGQIMQKHASEMKNNLAVEIGSYQGKSACYIGRAMPKGAELICIDPWQDSGLIFEEQYRTDENFALFKENVRLCGLEQKVTPIRDFSKEVAKHWSEPISYLYIDGGHQYNEVLEDIDGFAPHVISGGVILFDDYSTAFPGIMKAVQERFDDIVLHDVGIYESRLNKGHQRYLAVVRIP